MKLRMHRPQRGLTWLILGTIFIFACDNSQSDFEKTKKLNTIEAYTRFIAKYPVSHLSDDAKNLRDQLAFEMTADSTTTDSLAPLKTNVLENLFANAEQKLRNAQDDSDNVKAAEEFAAAAKFYHRAARIQKIVGRDPTEAYKRAAYAYYKAAKRSQAAQMITAFSALNSWLAKPGSFSVESLQTSTIISMLPYHLEKSRLYDKSAELFTKAGMKKHADWMKEGNTIKTFEFSELEIVPDTVRTKQIHEK